MYDSMDFETTPYGERCVQVGHEPSNHISRIEARALIGQLCRIKPKIEALNNNIKSNPHDFGSYTTLEVKFLCDSEAEELVYELESSIPEYWDSEAKEYLREHLPADYLATLVFAEQ